MILNRILFIVISFLLLGTIPSTLTAQSNKKENAEKKDKEKTYSDFITDKAKSKQGMFTVHEVEGKYFFEIPDSLLNRDIMAITRISKIASNS